MTEEQEVQLQEEDPAAAFEQAMGSLAEKIAESHTKLTEELSQSVGESISAGVKAALEEISAPGERKPVRAARYAVTREEPVYRFNGTGDSLVRDAWYAARERDDDALERIRKYRKQQEEIGVADVPFGHRPQSWFDGTGRTESVQQQGSSLVINPSTRALPFGSVLTELFAAGRVPWATIKRSMKCPKVLLGQCGPSAGDWRRPPALRRPEFVSESWI